MRANYAAVFRSVSYQSLLLYNYLEKTRVVLLRIRFSILSWRTGLSIEVGAFPGFINATEKQVLLDDARGFVPWWRVTT